MKIALVNVDDTNNIRIWNGIVFYLAQALKNIDGVELYHIDNLRAHRNKLFVELENMYIRLLWKLFRKHYDPERTIYTAKFYARLIEKRLHGNTDVIISPSPIPMAYLKSDKIKVIYTDGEFDSMIGYYSYFCNLSSYTLKTGHKLDEDGINNCDLVLYTSEWAVDGAKKNYRVNNPDKIKLVPFGPTVECNRQKDDIIRIIDNKKQDELRLLFVGVGWERKGGAIALETAAALHQRGINVHLDIVGSTDINIELPGYVESHGFISKTTAEGRKKINDLYENAHFFILPTRADCTPLVFCEASSFGLPALSTKTGGVPSTVCDNKSGKLFELSDNGEKYAEYIESIFADYAKYKELCFSSFEHYETCLNWNIVGQKIEKYINELLDRRE